MGVEEVAVALAIAGAAASASAAAQQNAATRRSASAANQQTADRVKQIQDAAATERLKEANNTAQIRGRVAVANAAAGLGTDGTAQDLDNQAGFDLSLNQQIINKNATAATTNASNDLNASLASLSEHIVNPVLAGFTGGLQGGEAGLQIGKAINEPDPNANKQTT